jgi:hypothetical protein
MHKYGWFPFRKHTANALSKFIFTYIFHLLSIDDVYQFHFAWRMDIPFPEEQSVLNLTVFKPFWESTQLKRLGKVLFTMSQCYQIRNNLLIFVFWYTSNIFLIYYNTDQVFSKAHFKQRRFLGLFMLTTVPCSLSLLREPFLAKRVLNSRDGSIKIPQNINCCKKYFGQWKKTPYSYD